MSSHKIEYLKKSGKIAFFSLFFQFKLIFRKIRSVYRTTDYMVLEFNLSFLRKNKNFQIGHAVFENSFLKIKQNNKCRNRSFSLKISVLKSKNRLKKTKKNIMFKNFEFLRTLSFNFFLSRHLQSPITQKVH